MGETWKFQDREFVEMEVPFNGAPKRPGSPSPLTSPAHSTASGGGLLRSCCGRCYPQRYQVRGQQHILASTTSISDLHSAPAPSSSSPSHNSPNFTHLPPPSPSPSPNPSPNPNSNTFLLDSMSSDVGVVPNVAFQVPRRIQTGGAPCSPYNETRVWLVLSLIETDFKKFLWGSLGYVSFERLVSPG